MSAIDLEARRWRAAVDAVNGKNELWVSLVHDEGVTLMTLNVGRATDTALKLWRELQATTPIIRKIKTAEWQEMLAQGVG